MGALRRHSSYRFSFSGVLLSFGCAFMLVYYVVLELTSTPATSPSGTNFHLAIFLQISNQTIFHLPRLLHRIYHLDNVYLVHFDCKIPVTTREATLRQAVLKIFSNASQENSPPKNVHILPCEHITYRGITMVLNTLSAMVYLLEIDTSWAYFINLSGSDYPLVDPHTLRRLLAVHTPHNLNFFSMANKSIAGKLLSQRTRTFHLDEGMLGPWLPSIDAKSQNLKSALVPFSYPVHNPVSKHLYAHGSYAESWMILSREFVQYATKSASARKLLLLFAYSLSSAEHYFPTLALNSHRFNRTIVPHAMRLILWKFDGRNAVQHPYCIDELFENVTHKESVKNIVRNTPLLFVRKFRKADAELMDFVDEERRKRRTKKMVWRHFLHKVNVIRQ